MLLLSVESDNGATLTYRLQKTRVSVGSGASNDVVVSGPGVAERHLVIQRSGSSFTFVTSERQNVVVNGERRSRGVLNPGDRLRLGTVSVVFRGLVGGDVALEEIPAPTPKTAEPSATKDVFTAKPEPGGFSSTRLRLLEVFAKPHANRTHRLITELREAIPEADFALLVPGEGDARGIQGVVLASIWSGEVPVIPSAAFRELNTPGRYVVVGGAKDGAVVYLPVRTPGGNLVALLAARPFGALGDEGVALLGEVVRLLGLFWEEVEQTDASFAHWELEAKHRLEALLPGTSQAIQVLREGLLQAARSMEPILICGAEGSGRTEVARLLSTLGPIAGRKVVIFEGRDVPAEVLRQELFGPPGKPTFSGKMEGILGEAEGGILVVRNAERLPETIQVELVGVIKAKAQEPLHANSVRFLLTCAEDPLALVQQGKLSSSLFMLFSQKMLRVPRIEERREDLPLIIASLLRQVAAEQGKNIRGISVECLNVLLSRNFPGQVMELVGELRRLVAATPDGEIVRCQEMASLVGDGRVSVGRGADILASDNLKEVLAQVEKLIIDRVMRKVKGNQSKAARILGISRGAVIAKLKEYGIPDYRYLRRR